MSYPQDPDLAALAESLAARREPILKRWEALIEADRRLEVPASISRSQLRDHIPAIIDDFAAALAAGGERGSRAVGSRGSEHGAERWEQGYDLPRVMREWAHLQAALLEEIERYAAWHPEASREAMAKARQALARLFGEGVAASACRYMRLREIEAEGQTRDLEQALSRLRLFERQQADLLRGAAHDLRGNLGIVNNATAALARAPVSDADRARLADMAGRAIEAQEAMLAELLELSRLQAGQERAEIAAFDAAALVAELCRGLEPIALQRGLFLRCSGPERLEVEGDALKLRRIAQNLVLNALKFTVRGGVSVTYGPAPEAREPCWALSVEDTGPGLELAGESVASAIKDPREPGEGIGLSIVKRLCDLLGARLEVAAADGHGTRFEIVFPVAY